MVLVLAFPVLAEYLPVLEAVGFLGIFVLEVELGLEKEHL
jgi:hypothetical protein